MGRENALPEEIQNQIHLKLYMEAYSRNGNCLVKSLIMAHKHINGCRLIQINSTEIEQ